MTAAVVVTERPAEGVGLVRINRPDARNALNLEVRRLLAQHLSEMGEDDTVRCIVLTGNEKSFAAGADIKEMADASAIDMLLRGTQKLWRTIYGCPKPVIAAVSGFALGGGTQLAKTTEIKLAAETAKVAQAHFE
jgi:enoyl-CoA hydratase